METEICALKKNDGWSRPEVFFAFVPVMWSIKPERCSMFSFDSGDRKQVWLVHDGAADQKCIPTRNHSALYEPPTVETESQPFDSF